MHSPFDYDRDCEPPYQFVPVAPSNVESPLPRRYRNRVVIHTVHDGGAIPKEYRFLPDGKPLVDPELLDHKYTQERDWGANFVAEHLARELGLPFYARVRMARVLLDFNRFPGSTPANVTDPSERLAIETPFAEVLNHARKVKLLEDYYDRISTLIERNTLIDKLIVLGVHTYDERNPSYTRRPDVSIVSRPAGYQKESRMPLGVFDPLYPDRLGESTCSRILRDRISLNLERAGFRVSHNHPYSLPDGSLEVRAQIWFFFHYLRKRFETEFPETVEEPAYRLVWTMLLNTNLRLAEAEALRGYLHRFRKVPSAEREYFERARVAYERIREFMADPAVVMDYRKSPHRQGSLALEVRKDLVCHFDPDTGRPLPRTPEIEQQANTIAKLIAGAIAMYFETDRQVD